jgi:hypothetical protein
MSTTPHEPFEDPDVTPSGDPDASPEPVGPGADPDTSPDNGPPSELHAGQVHIRL